MTATPLDSRTRAWREQSHWFREHFDDAAGEVVDFFGGDGLDLRDADVADIGCGDGIIDLGVMLRSKPASLVGYDIRPVDTGRLARIARAVADVDTLPPNLSFEQCGESTLPAPADAYDYVFSWSAFEHIVDPVGVLREVRRVLRPDGVLMIQLWPFFHSQHGSHLWEWSNEGFVQLLAGRQAEVESIVRHDLADDPEWAEERIAESRTLTRITLDELHRALLSSGFTVSKVEILSNSVHIPRELSRHRLSELVVGGVKLLANPS